MKSEKFSSQIGADLIAIKYQLGPSSEVIRVVAPPANPLLCTPDASGSFLKNCVVLEYLRTEIVSSCCESTEKGLLLKFCDSLTWVLEPK